MIAEILGDREVPLMHAMLMLRMMLAAREGVSTDLGGYVASRIVLPIGVSNQATDAPRTARSQSHWNAISFARSDAPRTARSHTGTHSFRRDRN